MIIDAHAHIYDILCGYGARGEFRPLGQGRGIWATGEVNQFFPPEYGDLGFPAESLLQLMNAAGIDHAVLLQGSNYGFHNHYVAEMAKKYPQRFTPSVTVDPYALHAVKVLEHFVEAYGVGILKFELSIPWGLRGIHRELMPDSQVMVPILQRADSLGMTVVIDTGPAEDLVRETDSLLHTRELLSNGNLVLAHCFFPKEDGRNPLRLEQLSRLADAGVLFDISNLMALWHADPLGDAPVDYLSGVRQAVGIDRMFWGSDAPGVLREYTYTQLLSHIRNTGLFSPEDLDLLLCDNAKAAYHIAL